MQNPVQAAGRDSLYVRAQGERVRSDQHLTDELAAEGALGLTRCRPSAWREREHHLQHAESLWSSEVALGTLLLVAWLDVFEHR